MLNEGRIAWITGGSQGIGYACAEELISKGYRVAISSRNKERLAEAATALSAGEHDVRAFPCDVAEEESIKSAYREIVAAFGPPTVLINSAGISPWSTFTETTTQEFDQAIAINTRGMFLCSREVLPAMYERKQGAIVQMLSVASIKGYLNGAAYVASKFAAHGFTNALREEARQHGVRVIAVLPGATETELWGETERKQYHERMMQPSDIAKMIASALAEPNRALVEEILIRPIAGDI
jgi:short-subunit dehydrogenase